MVHSDTHPQLHSQNWHPCLFPGVFRLHTQSEQLPSVLHDAHQKNRSSWCSCSFSCGNLKPSASRDNTSRDCHHVTFSRVKILLGYDFQICHAWSCILNIRRVTLRSTRLSWTFRSIAKFPHYLLSMEHVMKLACEILYRFSRIKFSHYTAIVKCESIKESITFLRL